MATGSTGSCYICGAELGKTAMKNHLLKAHGCDAGELDTFAFNPGKVEVCCNGR